MKTTDGAFFIQGLATGQQLRYRSEAEGTPMRFSNSFLDEIRDRVPISQVIRPRLTYDKRKTNAARGDYWACCPFHGQKTPSFQCDARQGRFHRYGVRG